MKFAFPLNFRRLSALILAAAPLLGLAQTNQGSRPANIINLAVRSTVTANQPMVAGFAIAHGPSAILLVRAVGPGLTPLSVPDAMPNPKLQIIDSAGRVVLDNDDWRSEPAPASSYTVAAAMKLSGAFPLAEGSRDAAAVVTLPAGTYSFIISGVSGADTGTVLGELYQLADPTIPASEPTPARLVNLSVRTRVPTANTIMGFAVGDPAGSTRPPSIDPPGRRFLLRAIGPTLRTFGIADALAAPKLQLSGGPFGLVMADNDQWDFEISREREVRQAAAASGAFPLTSGSHDAAFVGSVPTGPYTVRALGVNGATGEALLELYELSN